jgi:hypothetical protein
MRVSATGQATSVIECGQTARYFRGVPIAEREPTRSKMPRRSSITCASGKRNWCLICGNGFAKPTERSGPEGSRTPDLLPAEQALYQLSYRPWMPDSTNQDSGYPEDASAPVPHSTIGASRHRFSRR